MSICLTHPRTRWRLGFAAAPLWLLLGLGMYRTIASWSDTAPPEVEPRLPSVPPSGGDPSAATLDHYRVVWSRSLRQRLIEPPAPVAQQEEAQDRGVRLHLLGTAIEGGQSFAVLRSDRGRVYVAGLGADVESFIVQRIAADRVTLSREGSEVHALLPEALRQWIPKQMQHVHVEADPHPRNARRSGFRESAQPEAQAPTRASSQDSSGGGDVKKAFVEADRAAVTLAIRHLTAEQLVRDARLVPAQDGRGQLQGFLIDSIAQGSPLVAAGLRPGDVIVSVDGRVLRSIGDLDHLYASLEADQPHTWKLRRGTRWVDVLLNPVETQHENPHSTS